LSVKTTSVVMLQTARQEVRQQEPPSQSHPPATGGTEPAPPHWAGRPGRWRV